MVLFHLYRRPSPARVKTSSASRSRQPHVSVPHSPLPEWSVIRSVRRRDETRLWCQLVKCGEQRRMGKTKVTAAGGEKQKNPSHEPFKPRQSLQRSHNGQEPEREMRKRWEQMWNACAEHWSETSCVLIWNQFCCSPHSFFFFLNMPTLLLFDHFNSTLTMWENLLQEVTEEAETWDRSHEVWCLWLLVNSHPTSW